jgi:flagellar biosynthesis protein FlhG
LSSLRHDQAEGLRRLLDRSGLRVVAVAAASGRAMRSETVVNLAAALAELGSEVLILDESPPAQGIAAALGLPARFDLEDVIRGERDWDDVIVRGPCGIRVLPFSRAARTPGALSARQRQEFLQHCRFDLPVDTLLVNTGPQASAAMLWPDQAARKIMVLSGAGPAAVTEAYARIKRQSAEYGQREFHVVVGNVASEEQARTVFQNMAQVARGYLKVSLAYMGHVPRDGRIDTAARLRRPVVTAFPDSAASSAYRQVAQAIHGWPLAAHGRCGFDEFMQRLTEPGLPCELAASTRH